MDSELKLSLSNLLIATNATAEFFTHISNRTLDTGQNDLESLIIDLHNSDKINLHDCVLILDSTANYFGSIDYKTNRMQAELFSNKRQEEMLIRYRDDYKKLWTENNQSYIGVL